ncbi:GNAT family N-acetyltransferase [Nocardioides sp. GY 10113]|uniref:GNAT family N-acetyltransferase n=1 Tax=Nocardioides sp. GY 10113 TaxID=2569761 RepID=UPI001F0E1470|nr:GNAT family N-acetyltransferase [Nocardioides sp. GY 10113]
MAPLEPRHWPEVERIYAAGIAGGHATFETAPPTWERFDAGRLADHRLVALGTSTATGGERVLGWIAGSAYSSRGVYAGVVEESVYVDPGVAGQGVGRLLLEAFVASTEAAGVWTVQAGVFPENAASLALHRAAGFRVVGTRERIGRMARGPLAGAWRDVVLLERRSEVAGR